MYVYIYIFLLLYYTTISFSIIVVIIHCYIHILLLHYLLLYIYIILPIIVVSALLIFWQPTGATRLRWAFRTADATPRGSWWERSDPHRETYTGLMESQEIVDKWYIYMVLVGGFNHLEKYESQWEGLSHILWIIKNVWNHQPGYINGMYPPVN